jgi:hypothetical protein
MADKPDDKETLTPVGPGADEDSETQTPPEGRGAGEDYDYPEGEGEGEEGARAAGDERAGHGEEGADEDERNWSPEKRRRRRKRERFESAQRELNFLRTRNEQLEREHSRRLATMENRQTQSDVLAIDGRIAQAESDVREAETLFQQALDAKDTAAATEALRVRDSFRDGLRELRGVKQQTLRTAQTRQTAANQTQEPDPEIVARAQVWQREHSWFDPKLRDEDSAIAFAVEQTVFREGRLQPRSDDYWEEVDRRLAKRLPERYDVRGRDPDDDDEDDDERGGRAPRNGQRRVNGDNRTNGARRPSGPTIKVGGRERTLRKGEVFIDEDRKAAMIEAGVWDDPTARDRFLKAYQTYDREAGRRPR